jgi:hypothetical protein
MHASYTKFKKYQKGTLKGKKYQKEKLPSFIDLKIVNYQVSAIKIEGNIRFL